MKDLVRNWTAAQGIPLSDEQAELVARTWQAVLSSLEEAEAGADLTRVEPPVQYLLAATRRQGGASDE